MSTFSRDGLTAAMKAGLIERVLKRRQHLPDSGACVQDSAAGLAHGLDALPASAFRFDRHPDYLQLRMLREGAARFGIENPYFRAYDGIAGAEITFAGERYLNFSSYNYLGLCGHPAVSGAAHLAIERYGTSVCASRLVSGERPIHAELERALAALHGTQDCVAFVSGHATNVSTIGCLFGPKDLILHDALIHNSALVGAQLSGAHRLAFPHNDWEALDRLLAQHRLRHERVLVVLEGIYSMDGDYPDLPRFIELKRRHRVFLMVDEAHSLGVMGAGGLGLREHFGLRGDEVDIWMGTLSKTLASCGGYIAGERALIEHLKCAAPGFLYSVGMPAASAAAALAALDLLRAEPQRAVRLRERGRQFLELARARGIDTGLSAGLSVIPALTGSSVKAARLSAALFRHGINVQPIVHPAVPEGSARLRFFISCEHTEAQIERAVARLDEEWRRL